MIPYGKHHLTEQDIAEVNAVLHSDWLTQGPQVPIFESSLANKFGAKYAVAVNSATSALHVAMMAIGMGLGDCLWTVPNTFVASANCAVFCGADVDFVDIDPKSFNIDASLLAQKLEMAEKIGRLPKAVVAVHFGGTPCDMTALHVLKRKYGFFLIEDASHAVGAFYGDDPIGNCRFSDITVLSFHPVKIITTGEGGVALTNDEDLMHKMDLARSHGITRDRETMVGEVDGPWTYQQIDIGYNYRMTDIAAALGRSQLLRLDEMVANRTAIADRYESALNGLNLLLQARPAQVRPSWHLYVVCLEENFGPSNRLALFEFMRESGIGVAIHYAPVHLQPFYRKKGFEPGMFPASESYYQRCLSLPIYPKLQRDEQDHIIAKLQNFLNR
jgi:UDP-4-amino-4,6-dideoxy-N-acetyl-beta-L-altrosamine transaminase